MKTTREIEQELLNLDQKDLAELLERVFVSTRVRKSYPNGDFQYDDVLCLARCSFGSNDGLLDKAAIIELYAPPNREEAEEEAVLCEQGACEKCGAWLVSSAQIASCPICEERAHLT